MRPTPRRCSPVPTLNSTSQRGGLGIFEKTSPPSCPSRWHLGEEGGEGGEGEEGEGDENEEGEESEESDKGVEGAEGNLVSHWTWTGSTRASPARAAFWTHRSGP